MSIAESLALIAVAVVAIVIVADSLSRDSNWPWRKWRK